MPRVGALGRLETERLILRPSDVDDAEVFHRLWTERDPRVPPHRRITSDGRPSLEDVAASITRAGTAANGPRLLSVQRKEVGDVIGYCGLIADETGSREEPVLAYELLRTVHGCGYATEAGAAVVAWASRAGFLRLRATVWDWNIASRRVLSKLGFEEAGTVEPTTASAETLLTVREL